MGGGGFADGLGGGRGVKTLVRCFPNPIRDRRASDFLGSLETKWAPDLLRASLHDTIEDYRAKLPKRALLAAASNGGANPTPSSVSHEAEDATSTHDSHVYRTVMWSTIRSVTLHERLLLVVLSVHCLGLALMAFFTIGLGTAGDQIDVLDADLMQRGGSARPSTGGDGDGDGDESRNPAFEALPPPPPTGAAASSSVGAAVA